MQIQYLRCCHISDFYLKKGEIPFVVGVYHSGNSVLRIPAANTISNKGEVLFSQE